MHLTCPDCGEAKPAADYYKDKSMATGRMKRCKDCHKQRAKSHYHHNVKPPRVRKAMNPKPCNDCGKTFTPDAALQLYCSTSCRRRSQNRKRNDDYQPRPADWGKRAELRPGWQRIISACAVCNSMFTPIHPSHITCSEACKEQNYARRMKLKSDLRRARMHRVDYEPLDRREVFERDEWVCGLCGEQIDPELKYPDRMSASLDHLIPVSEGGPHTMSNVQASHWICNVRRGTKELEKSETETARQFS